MFFKSFIYGILAASGALLTELIILYFASPDYFSGADAGYASSAYFLLAAAACEELFKAAFIWKLKSQTRNVELWKTAPFVGMGLFVVEFAFKKAVLFQGSYWPFLGIFLIHTVTASILGYFLWKMPEKKLIIAAVILFNISLHFAYNLVILGL